MHPIHPCAQKSTSKAKKLAQTWIQGKEGQELWKQVMPPMRVALLHCFGYNMVALLISEELWERIIMLKGSPTSWVARYTSNNFASYSFANMLLAQASGLLPGKCEPQPGW